MIVDFQFPAKAGTKQVNILARGPEGLSVGITAGGDLKVTNDGKEVAVGRIEKFAVNATGGWNRAIVDLGKDQLSLKVNGVKIVTDLRVEGLKTEGEIGFSADGPVGLMHPFVLGLK